MYNFEDELTCSVCYNIFDDPQILPCSHTFCRNCLEKVIRSSGSGLWRISVARLKCPSCRNTSELPQSGTLALPINFALKSIVEKYKTPNHVKAATCPEHNKQPLNLFCLKDKKLICGQCLTVGQHQGHAIDDPESSYLREKLTASKYLHILSDKHFTGVSFVIKKLEEQMTYCKQIVLDDKKEVMDFFDQLNETLEQKKQNMLAALNDLNQQIVEVYAPKIEEMKEIQDEELDLISLSSSVQEETSPLLFLENLHNIRKRMKALKKREPITVLPVAIYPQARQVLNNEWLKGSLAEINLLSTPTINLCFEMPEKSKTLPDKWTVFCILLMITLFFVLIIWLYNSITVNHFASRYMSYLYEIMEPVRKSLGSDVYRKPGWVSGISHKFSYQVYCD
ncbi:tripartite motif-containing protein 59 [Xenopus laevis]|uniref:Tripartite motif-containing protein 59 n=2 Tax=Xenopus laevis TaxID=8355 RepID=A0AA97PYR4_XENLA|nr:tripartite motif-containing protein 59 [Xenopus laevis]OCT55902.1 hypothetical protein XELAEV_18001111mg [Xenopus laevis]